MITNQMLPNGNTRCWDRHGMYEVPTDPSQIRKPMVCALYKVQGPPDDKRRVGSMGATQGYKERIVPWDELVKK